MLKNPDWVGRLFGNVDVMDMELSWSFSKTMRVFDSAVNKR